MYFHCAALVLDTAVKLSYFSAPTIFNFSGLYAIKSGLEDAMAWMVARKPSLVTDALLRNFTVIFRNLLV